jgi:hypothetical protein
VLLKKHLSRRKLFGHLYEKEMKWMQSNMNKSKRNESQIKNKATNWIILKSFILLSMLIISQSSFFKEVKGYDQIEPYEPQHIDAGEIPNLGPYRNPVPKEYRVYLEEGHKYHIFLVGDWITNSTEATDYDIEVRNPNNAVVSINTESAGLPEQVANDNKHQYFVPSQTGDYRFLIYNDPEDSPLDSADAADFMVIEHIEINKLYTKKLYGKPHVGAEYPNGYKIGYEFNTSSPQFLLNIDVPDPVPTEGIKGLDMYEARVYPMANPENDIGYTIQGVGVPFGDRLYEEGATDKYGGYNTEIEGFRFSDMRISCESAGVDMRQMMKMEEDLNASEIQNIFYYLVLLAEYFEGELEFYIKTDYSPVNLTLIDPPNVGYVDETTLIKVESESVTAIDEIWIEFTTDSWSTRERIDLIEKPEYWLAALPSFDLHDHVDYKIHAIDEIDNFGLIEGSFEVMNKVDIDFGISGSVIQGGQTLKITGRASKPSINLQINIEHGGNINSINIQTDGDGVFTYDYRPTKIGEYDVTISYAGDEDYHSTVSREKSFRVDKRKLSLVSWVETNPAKVERPMTISGSITPPVSGLDVEIIFVSPENSFTKIVTTGRNGDFSLTIIPEFVGYWDVLPQIKVTELFDASQGSLITFEVQNLTPVDIVMYRAFTFTQPPLLYVPIGLGTVLTGGLFIKFRSRKKRHDIEESKEKKSEIDDRPKGVTAYRRRSAR